LLVVAGPGPEQRALDVLEEATGPAATAPGAGTASGPGHPAPFVHFLDLGHDGLDLTGVGDEMRLLRVSGVFDVEVDRSHDQPPLLAGEVGGCHLSVERLVDLHPFADDQVSPVGIAHGLTNVSRPYEYFRSRSSGGFRSDAG